ncbi:hypothetical protein SRRS_49220 [Sporomusa rhizae]|uniref:hypothetical protein n=1 Tax=Sporomusa rhizae TaxID=357999 RepID=UPI00352AB695
MEKVELFGKQNLHLLIWPETCDGQYAKEYLTPLILDGVEPYIKNVNTEVMIVKVGDCILPITINNGEYDNPYVCSPYNHYVSYAVEELRELKNPTLEKMLSGVINTVGYFLRRMDFNKVVHVNNWLLSTNLYPALTDDEISEILGFLQMRFPCHTLVFRSINAETNSSTINSLTMQGCVPVASRQIYGVNLRSGVLPSTYDLKKDIKLLVNTPYEIHQVSQLSAEDALRIKEIYNMLYLDKYSYHNPWFTEKFIEYAARSGILNFVCFCKEQQINAVIGYFQRNGVMTTPIVGYDTNIPTKTGLYRLISIKILLEAAKNRLYLNNSSGAAQFKRNRGSVGHIEYSLVYYKHLPWWRRLPWLVLAAIVNKIGIPLMKKYRL